jgi:predicted MFS family arabinose efflux permease
VYTTHAMSDRGAEGTRRGGAIRSALRHRDFRDLVAAQAVSATGDWLYSVALIVYVLDQTGSSTWVAATSIIRFLPYMLFGTLGGVIADHYDRRRIMIAADLGRGVVQLGLTAVALAEGHALLAIVLAALSTTFSAAYLPCINASTPALVGEDDLTAANAINATVENVALALGPAVGGILLLLGSPATAFAVNAATFFVSAALTVPIHTRLSTAVQEEEEGSEAAPRRFSQRVKEGVRAISSSSEIALLVILAVALMVFYGQEIVLYALAAEQRLGMGSDGVGFLFAAMGVGGILAAGLVGRASDASKQGGILTIASIVSALPMMMLALVHEPAVALVLLTIEGGAVIVADVIYMTMLQRILPPEVLGRVMGIMDSLLVAGILVGSLLAPLVVSLAGLEVALVVGGALLIVPALLVLPRARAIDRATSARVAELGPRVEVLGRTRIFEAANRQTLEALAAALTEERVAPGAVLIREGDEPDDLFVLVAGTVGISARGEGREDRAIRELGPGDYFGEIGLLERVPRTATVTAKIDCDVYRIGGEDFLRIVTGEPMVAGNFRAGVATRLAVTHPAEELGHA